METSAALDRVRLAGNVGGAVIVIEPPKEPRPGEEAKESRPKKSGFVGSILLGGADNFAGEIGHGPIAASTIERLNEERPDELTPLVAQRCSCSEDDAIPDHLEAFASVLAITQRVAPEEERSVGLERILANANEEPYEHALGDIGRLVGDALAGPVAILNPTKIVATGSLAIPGVCKKLKESVEAQHKFGTIASVTAISEMDNDYVRARGAALAMIRIEVHRRLEELLGGTKEEAEGQVKELTTRLPENPL